jgi:CRP/FNR family transcriptional regulator, cyclic AMP receptor protein
MHRPPEHDNYERLRAQLDSPPLADLAPRVQFYKGMEIGTQDEPCDSLYIISEGQVLMSRRNPGGGDYALYLLGPGDLFGEGSLRPRRRWLANLRAVTNVVAHRLPASQLPRFAQYYPQLVGYVMSLLSARLERSHQRRDVLGTYSARDRVIGLLVALAEFHGERQGDEVWLPLSLTQAELGEMVGLARETVARVLADLEEEGAIRRRTRSGLSLRASLLTLLSWLLLLPHLGFATA